jgi:membrane associated rhomboid family serine protease
MTEDEGPRQGAEGGGASGEAAPPEPETAPALPIELGPSGFRGPGGRRRREVFVAYRDVTHVALLRRAVAVGTTRGIVLLRRASLGGDAASRAVAEALRERVFALPDGEARRARFARLDAKARVRRPLVAGVLVGLTGVAFLLQWLAPSFYEATIYRPHLLALGEWWRYATTQFLHANLYHLGVNAVAALIAGTFAERALGRAGTLFVAGAAGFGAMWASRYGEYGELLGASGIAAGFFGALVAIELLAPEEAPASARFPRSILFGVVALQAVIDALPATGPAWSSHVAGLAHLGGFLAGAGAALLVREGTRGFVRAGAVAAALTGVASFGAAARYLVDPVPALERQAHALLERPVANPGELNNLAWLIATARRPTASALETARELAEIAVMLTGRREPTLLDTLAEVYFVQGRTDDALEVIDEAISLAPGESYYEEQRRRYTGERAAEDRPPPPEQAQPEGGRGAPGDAGEMPPPGEIVLPPGDEITV